MSIRRRELLAGGLAAAVAGPRSDFPWATRETYLNAATEHPIGIHSHRAMDEYLHALTYGPDSARNKFENGELMKSVKEQFARLINAKPSEIGFVPSTQIGENLVLEGLNIQQRGANVVTNDLHYGGSLLNYRQRKNAGMDVRIVAHRDYQIDFGDLERVVDSKTRLIAIALVSNVNGYLHDIQAISKLAHAHGAYVYVDAIQAAGAVPIDVRAMGIDFLACSAYKWLMGGRFGYLYVKEELQGSVLEARLFGGRSAPSGAGRYEISTASHVGCVCQDEALRYIHRVGVTAIRNQVRTLTDHLQDGLAKAGYRSITPRGTESPIVTLRVKDYEATRARLKKAGVVVTLRGGEEAQMRVSPSIYNTVEDIDRLLTAL